MLRRLTGERERGLHLSAESYKKHGPRKSSVQDSSNHNQFDCVHCGVGPQLRFARSARQSFPPSVWQCNDGRSIRQVLHRNYAGRLGIFHLGFYLHLARRLDRLLADSSLQKGCSKCDFPGLSGDLLTGKCCECIGDPQ